MQRSTEKELLDLGPDYYSANEYQDALVKLDRIGALLGGDRASQQCISSLPHPPKSILDVGCGGGFFTQKLGRLFPNGKIIGIDLDSEAISFAEEKNTCDNVSFVHAKDTDWDYPTNTFDLVIATLVCHHMSDNELVNFLKKTDRIAKEAVIINDLHRHPLALYSFRLITPILFPNRLILHDGSISIKKGFIKEDWINFFTEAGIPEERYEINWKWAFRWLITIKSSL